MKAVIYARYSPGPNQREESIEGQIRECSEFAERKGITIINTYVDRSLSAKTDNRPEFQKLIKDSHKHLFDVVLVWKLDRFARDRYDSAHYKNILKKNGIKVISAKEHISDGAEGIILEAMLEGMAEYYSVELSEKIVRGMTENALKCKSNGGIPTFGYVLDENRNFQIDETTAPIVEEIFNRYINGEQVKDITASINAREIKATTGRPFNKHTVHLILRNRRYIGEYKYREIVMPNGIPAIISLEVFEKVQKRLNRNKKAPALNKAKVEYLLTTKLFCGKCEAFMVGESGTGRQGIVHNYYKCNNRKFAKSCDKKTVKKDYIERLVVENTVQTVLNDKCIDQIADVVMEIQGRENTELPRLQNQLKETQKSIDNMIDAIEQGIITSSTKERLEKLEKEKETIEIAIINEKIQKPILTKEQIVFWISKFKGGDIDSFNYRRQIIDVFVNSVYLHDDKMLINYNYKEDTKTVILGDLCGSDLGGDAPPTILETLTM